LIFGCPIPFTSTRRHTILPAEVPSARRQGAINPPQADKHCEKHFRKTRRCFWRSKMTRREAQTNPCAKPLSDMYDYHQKGALLFGARCSLDVHLS
jgi:hypothetical protein